MPNRQQFSPLILIYTEGKYDALLIKHIQKLYGRNHKIRQGNGSTPEIILRSCVKELGAFDKRYCVLDGDTIQDITKFQELINQYQSKLDYDLIVVITYPCIEAVNLALLFEDDTGFEKANCGELKKRLKLQMEGKDREDYYIQNLTKAKIKQSYKLFKNRDFEIILNLFVSSEQAKGT